TPDDYYLLSAHLDAGQMYVIDLRTNKIVATVLDTPGAEGVEYVPELKKAYTSNAGDNSIGVVDLRQMKVIKKIPTEAKPDGSAYAASFHKLYVSDERGKAEAIVDVRTDNLVKTLHFDSEAGMPQYDPIAQKVYVNLQDKNIFAVIDPATDEVVGRYPVEHCEGNHGMTLDPEHHRAFLSCEGNDLMAVFNLDTHQPIAFLPMAGGPDVIKFDPGLRRIYVACSSGAISVFQMDDPDQYRKLKDFPDPSPPSPQEVARMAEAVRADRAPRLDGTLNDPLWQSAKPITNFRQREPHEGEAPTEKTEVRILHTRHAVYFGIYCYDSEPSRIIATELRRDVSQDLDDHFEILIDSNHNRRGAYVFEFNPLGTQDDGLIVEEQGDPNGGDFDRGWDGVWASEARITRDGWTATIEIPFTTLNFIHSSDVVWGLNL